MTGGLDELRALNREVEQVDEWHGWSVRGRGAIHVGYLPGRKSACLYVVRSHDHGGSALDVLAYFSSVEKAREGLSWLDSLARTVGGTS